MTALVRLGVVMSVAVSMFAAGMSVRQAQELLKSKGYYKGTVDGVSGPQTKKALQEYQRAQGLTPSGTIDSKTAASLESAAPSEAAGNAAGTAKTAKTDSTSSVKGTTGTLKEAEKDAASSTKSESKSALGEVKGVFGSKKKTK
jgi:peptidoglycan hydrolase-like protein with peptidoglycan-binding domain